jgi:hypothetical protein
MVKLLVLGYGRHGKDTVCSIINLNYGLSFESSSMFCAKHFIYQAMNDMGYQYSTFEECYADRHNERDTWYRLIREYNKPDAAKLGREIFAEYDIYCGLRHKAEFNALKNTRSFDYAIWVDRSDHLPKEPKTSNTIKPWMCDFVIDNNGYYDELVFNTCALMDTIVGKKSLGKLVK